MARERTRCSASLGNLGQSHNVCSKSADWQEIRYLKIIRDAVQDPLMPAKMAASESVAKQLQPFLAIFQSDNPLLPFMASTLQKIIAGLMKRFVKADVLQKATSAVKLLKLDLSEKKTFLEINKVDIGFVAVDKLKKLQAEKKISDR